MPRTIRSEMGRGYFGDAGSAGFQRCTRAFHTTGGPVPLPAAFIQELCSPSTCVQRHHWPVGHGRCRDQRETLIRDDPPHNSTLSGEGLGMGVAALLRHMPKQDGCSEGTLPPTMDSRVMRLGRSSGRAYADYSRRTRRKTSGKRLEELPCRCFKRPVPNATWCVHVSALGRAFQPVNSASPLNSACQRGPKLLSSRGRIWFKVPNSASSCAIEKVENSSAAHRPGHL